MTLPAKATPNLVLVSSCCHGYDKVNVFVDDKGAMVYKHAPGAAQDCGWVDPARLSADQRMVQFFKLYLYRVFFSLKKITA